MLAIRLIEMIDAKPAAHGLIANSCTLITINNRWIDRCGRAKKRGGDFCIGCGCWIGAICRDDAMGGDLLIMGMGI